MATSHHIQTQRTIILFYLNGCIHCQMLKPTWESVKKAMGNNSGISFKEIEYNDLHKLPPQLQKVSGFPTIQVVDKSKILAEYSGDRSMLSIMDFAKKWALTTTLRSHTATKPTSKSSPAKPKAKATASSGGARATSPAKKRVKKSS